MLFSASFYYLTHASVENTPDTTRAGAANVQARAAALADIIVASGEGWYDSTPCIDAGTEPTLDAASFDPDAVSVEVDGEIQGRFGLGEELCLRGAADSKSRNNLSYQKLMSLYKSADDADPSNDRVDYEEARKSLGLAEGEDFHIRSWPIMSSVQQILENGYRDPLMRPLYIGDYEDASETLEEEIEHTYTIVDASDRITIRLTIKNTGTEAAIFGSVFELPLDKNTVDFTLHTPLLASQEEHTIQLVIRKSSDWVWGDSDEKWLTYEIQDRDGEVGDGTISLSGVTMTYVTQQTNVFLEADEMYWVKEGASVDYDVSYMAFTGDGTKKKTSDWKIISTSPLGIPSTVALASNAFDGTVEQTALLEGAYKQDITTLSALFTASWNIDYVNIVDAEDEVHAWTTGSVADITPNPSVAIEGAFLAALVEDFDNGVFNIDYDTVAVPYVAEGDIYPDLKSVMDNDLVEALTDDNGDPVYDYTMLIVGSDVDHNAMTSHASKDAIAEWVMEGGTLIVFGSEAQSVQWLRPLFQASLGTANGPIQTPDEGHPILQVPNALDYTGYAYDHQWAFGSDADESFTEVVGTGSGSILAVGNAGSFGDGRVILSSWRPFELLEDQTTLCAGASSAECQALMLIHNALTLSYQYLFLDFGPAIPTDSAVGSQLRVVSVYHPELRELVPMQLQVFVFD